VEANVLRQPCAGITLEKEKIRMAMHYRIKFEPTGIQAEVDADTSIAEATQSMNVPIRADCGGKGLCGKCGVIADPSHNLSALSESELDILSREEIRKSY